jgi:heme exporter protein C
MRKWWWKILTIFLLLYTVIGGILQAVPVKKILNETIRNIFYHVPMWFGMMILFIVSVVYAVRYLRHQRLQDDIYSREFAKVGMLFGVLGLVTGAIWANWTWGKPWSNDIKQIGAAIALLIYAAYFVLRNSVTDLDKQARIAAVYNIFAFAMLFPAIWIIPRLVESLHPGGAGNPGADPRDMDSRMRIIFWLGAVPGWTLLGVWLSTLRIRIQLLADKSLLNDK